MSVKPFDFLTEQVESESLREEFTDMIFRGFRDAGFKSDSFESLEAEVNRRFIVHLNKTNNAEQALKILDDEYKNLISHYKRLITLAVAPASLLIDMIIDANKD